MAKAQAQEPNFGEGFAEYKPGEFIKWDEVGKTVKGILIDVKYNQPNELNPSKPQTVYTLQLEDGKEVRVAKESIDDAMKKVHVGQWVGLFYAEEVPPKKKGNHPFKNVKVYPGPYDEKFGQAQQVANDFGGEVVE